MSAAAHDARAGARARRTARAARSAACSTDRPLIMLAVLLVLLLIACEIAQPGYLSGEQAGTILRLAAPLAILAAGQTLVMLTGGIDLSIGFTATAAAYIMAGQSSRGTVVAILIALGVGLLIGTLNGIGVGIFRVQPLIMTLGMALDRDRAPDRARAGLRHRRARGAGLRPRAGDRLADRRRPEVAPAVGRRVDRADPRAAALGLRADALRRTATTRSPCGSPARARGSC